MQIHEKLFALRKASQKGKDFLKMNTLRKIVAVIMVLAMAFSLTACGDTSWIVKVDGETVPSGVYIYYQTAGYSAAGYELAAADQNYYYYMMYGLSYLDQKVGDKTVPEYMNDYALSMSKQYIVVEKLFDELGLELSEDDKKLIDTQVNSLWNNNSEQFEKIGVGKESIRKVTTNAVKEDKVFNAYYEVGGINGTTEDDIKAYLEDNYVRVKFMTFNYADSADDAVDEARKNKALEDAQSYLDRITAGEDINALIEEHAAEVEAANEAENESGKENLPEIEDEPEDVPEDDDAEDEVAVEEPADPYAHENIINKESKSPSEKFVNYVFTEIKTGEVKLVQDDLNIYVVSKMDVLERNDVYDTNRESFLFALFDSDFTKLVNDKLAGYSVEVNDSSVKRYKAEKAVEKPEE